MVEDEREAQRLLRRAVRAQRVRSVVNVAASRLRAWRGVSAIVLCALGAGLAWLPAGFIVGGVLLALSEAGA